MGQEGRTVPPDAGLDMRQHQVEERVLPPQRRRQVEPCRAGRCVEGGRIALRALGVHGREDIEPVAVRPKGLGHRQAFEGGGDVRRHAAMPDAGGQHAAEKQLRFLHQPIEAEARGVPFEHGEFWPVARAELAVAPHPCQFEDRPGAGHQ